jgi:hypothetical protein
MKAARYIPNKLNPSRFNRRIHQLSDWLEFALETIGELCRHGEVYIIDSMPLAVCQRVRATRCKKVRGRILWVLRGEKAKILWVVLAFDLR